MKIAVCFKVVPDDQDILVNSDRSLDYSKAQQIVSTYDLNAIEVAAQLASTHEASLVALTAGSALIDSSKLKKGVLSRGVDELFMIADDACTNMDALATAAALADLVTKNGGFDLIICGDGSADNFARQVDVQLAAKLGLPVVTSASKLAIEAGALVVERSLEDVIEVVRVSMPAVVSVTPDAALPRIPGMKEIVAAGKKPSEVQASGSSVVSALEVLDCRAPEQVARKLQVIDASQDGAIEQFVAALKAAV
ncbi:MAG: electron transfer flavoprotein [Coriobacteriia bacterium]|nr:electron transfer flavoprotein [Coriobacteriia bacterium]MCL2750040.1 electron transfer flavoprotein [Coriobacteriia bacterium]